MKLFIFSIAVLFAAGSCKGKKADDSPGTPSVNQEGGAVNAAKSLPQETMTPSMGSRAVMGKPRRDPITEPSSDMKPLGKTGTQKSTSPVFVMSDVVVPLDHTPFDPAPHFSSETLKPGLSVLINAKNALASKIIKDPAQLLLNKGRTILAPCGKSFPAMGLEMILLVSSSNTLISKKGTEKARYAVASFSTDLAPFIACLKKHKSILPTKSATLFTLARDPKTFLSLKTKGRIIMAKGEWATAVKSERGILGAGEILGKLTTSALGVLIGQNGPGANRMAVSVTLGKGMEINSNTLFSSVEEAKKGAAKFDFLKALPPKMQAPLKDLRLGLRGKTVGVYFKGDEKKSRALVDLLILMIFKA
ncbi:hypothetical protein KJ865_01960 [Myxococcota bacterium]|nr:hypothetical protein [Myxococcota bacterium]